MTPLHTAWLRPLHFAVTALVLAFFFVGHASAQSGGGQTSMSWDAGHGTQVEYLSAAGGAYLWYPGNRRIVEGRWKREGADICFRYGENTYNPVTRQRGGDWECQPFAIHSRQIVEQTRGDPLGLARRGAVPFPLERARTTLGKLLARVSPGAEVPESKTPGEAGEMVGLTCQSVIANADRDRRFMAIASSVYFHGQFLGKRCVEVDYERAFGLAEGAGLGVEGYLKILRERAATGNPRAIAALRLLGR